jgi:mannose-1-phosphate guanylyltransferase
MKIFLLGAGLGTRLKPLTDNTPKCLVPINGIPLIQYWLGLIKNIPQNDIYLNTHYLHNQVENYFQAHNLRSNVKLLYERKLFGSLGTLLHNIDYYRDEDYLLVCYSDNLTNIKLDNLISFHKSHNYPISMGVFSCNNPRECGIAEMDSENIVKYFEEKPDRPLSNLANAGVYVIDVSILHSFNKKGQKGLLDIAKDLIPLHLNRIKGYLIEEFLLDIGTMSNYVFANNYVRQNPSLFNTNISN